MGDIVNLHKARKRANKQQETEQAAANRISHGRTKAERRLQSARTEQARRLLDGHKTDTGDGDGR